MIDIERFVCNPFQENCYVASDETGDAVIVDCGAFYDAERRGVINYVTQKKLTVRHLIATHGHVDHNYGNNTVYERLGACVEVHHRDERLMNTLAAQSVAFCGYEPDYTFPPVGKYLCDTDTIAFGSHVLTVIPTPGHTPGSVVFFCDKERIAFSGDTLFKGGIGRTDFTFGCQDDIMTSLENIIATLPPDTVVLPGHGERTTIEYERRHNPFLT